MWTIEIQIHQAAGLEYFIDIQIEWLVQIYEPILWDCSCLWGEPQAKKIVYINALPKLQFAKLIVNWNYIKIQLAQH